MGEVADVRSKLKSMTKSLLFISLAICSCSGTVKGYKGSSLPKEQVAEITGKSGFGPFGGKIGIAAANGIEFTANPAPDAIDLKPGVYDFKLELRYETISTGILIPTAVPYQCVTTVSECRVEAGKKYLADYYRLPKPESEDATASNIGVRITDIEANKDVCLGSGICPDF